ncbi:MAG: hypothetical protein JWS12_210 [Candidatus Saccharibacteria bacterium]|nr:hypothetical protein [Candidatus Saccharibacteria bacterium]
MYKKLSDQALIAQITDGAVGILPTDTLYGLVCRAQVQTAVQRLYSIKKLTKPGTIIAASVEQLVELGLKARYVKAVENFWPSALSVVLPCGPELAYLHLGSYSLAVRIPKHAELQNLLQATGPLLTTSANPTGQRPANTVTEAQKYFGQAVDFYVDGGNLSGQKPSTIIRIVDDAIEVLREGAVTINENGRITS